MLEALISERKAKAVQEIREKHPEILREGMSQEDAIRYSREKKVPAVIEHEVWRDLGDEIYWHSLSELKNLFQQKEGHRFSEDDLEKITREMIRQIMEGKKLAARVPKFDDVWNYLGNTPLEQFVSDEDRRNAVNVGFWTVLKELSGDTDDNRTNWGKPKDAKTTLNNILNYRKMKQYFDFSKGVEKAEEMPSDLLFFEGVANGVYAEWYEEQAKAITSACSKEKATMLCGKLFAPIVFSVLNATGLEIDNGWRKEIIKQLETELGKTEPVQTALEIVLEDELTDAFHNGEAYTHANIDLCAKHLIKKDELIKRIQRDAKIDIDKVPQIFETVGEYITEEVRRKYATKLEQEIISMKRFDPSMFKSWLTVKDGCGILPENYQSLLEITLEKYYKVKQRPNGDSLVVLSYGEVIKKLPVKAAAYLFADLMNKAKPGKANEVVKYFRNNPEFASCVQEYVTQFGAIMPQRLSIRQQREEGLTDKSDTFMQEHPELFKK